MTSRYLALKLSLWGQKTFMHSKKKIREKIKGLLALFPLKLKVFLKGILWFFPFKFSVFLDVFVKEFFGFFPLIFQCFCKRILDKFPFKNEKILTPNFDQKMKNLPPRFLPVK
jgi:hypothetical protein